MSRLVLALAFAATVAFGVANSSFAATNLTKYHVSAVQLGFSQAYARCKRYGWTLATERSPEETQAISDALAASGDTEHTHFIGGFQEKGGDFNPGWIWLDDGKDFEYTSWRDGNVSTSYECLIKLELTTYLGQWSTYDCGLPRYFICES